MDEPARADTSSRSIVVPPCKENIAAKQENGYPPILPPEIPDIRITLERLRFRRFRASKKTKSREPIYRDLARSGNPDVAWTRPKQ